MLKLQFRDRRKEAVWLVEKNFSIGNSSSNSLMIDDASIETKHAEIIQKGDELSLYDRSSNQSVKVNGESIEAQKLLSVGDIVTLGQVELELIDPKSLINDEGGQISEAPQAEWAIFSSASWLEQNNFPISNKVVIGRDPSCDITIPLDYLSRRHVELEIRSNQLILKDLDSANGTFLNGSKVNEAIVKPGDKIKLDVLTFEVRGPEHDPHRTIIRSAPTKQKPAPIAETQAKSQKPAKSKPTPSQSSPTTKPSSAVKQPNPKKLVSEGKQDWISNSDKNKDKSRTGLILLITSGLLAVISAGIILSQYV